MMVHAQGLTTQGATKAQAPTDLPAAPQASASGYRLDKEEGPGDSVCVLQSPTNTALPSEMLALFSQLRKWWYLKKKKMSPKMSLPGVRSSHPAGQGLGSLTMLHTG